MNSPILNAEEIQPRVRGRYQPEDFATGHLVVLPTKAEVESRFKPIRAYITAVSAQKASTTLKAIDHAIRQAEPSTPQPIQHLRRFVKYEHLPSSLQNEACVTRPKYVDTKAPEVASISGRQPDGPVLGPEEGGKGLDEVATTAYREPPVLYLLICAISDLNIERLQAVLASIESTVNKAAQPTIDKIIVPGLPPTSEAQAKQWSHEYWPTIYKKHNPFGAHPAVISRATAEIGERVGDYMNLARRVGRQASDSCAGEDIGVVIVDRSRLGSPSIVMVAGDARWNLTAQSAVQGNSNVMAHAVMRAIGLIAQKRQALSTNASFTTKETYSEAFTDKTLTPMEEATYARSRIEPGGYLCLDLEVYITHEPCVMCSMALLHSRVGRVVFEKCMPSTGALTAGGVEGQGKVYQGLGYGLFWRPSLNWKFLAWQWTDDDFSPSDLNNKHIHV